jgi:predicted AlkP superfamily phosphohydrolase/phosphomutase
VRVAAGDRTSELAPGEWSDWHVFDFDFNVLVRMRGMGRFYNQTTLPPAGDAVMEVLLSPIHFHPSTGPLVGWCHPGQHGEEVADELGLLKTMGWAIDTWTVSDGLTWDRQSLEDAIFTAEGFERLMKLELAAPDIDLYVQVFSFPDRIQHVFWRLTDPEHPAYDAALALEFEGVVEQAYERMDRIVGEARALSPKEAAFIVVSDHGFASFRRGVNLNRWLVNHGYMVLERDPCARGTGGGRSLDDLFGDQGGVFSEVDWGRTRAYAMGLGNVYVNLAGREAQGIVRPGREYQELLDRLSAELPELVDEQTGERPVHAVYRRDRMYSGYDPEVVPDLRVANNPGYRVSWDTVLGGVPCEEVTDNVKAWGADHCSLEPSLVKGILLANRPLGDEAPDMADLAPTILEALGLPVPEGLDGDSLL